MSDSVFPTFQDYYYTPLRDALRLRFNGRLNWQATLTATTLPSQVQAKIRVVVTTTRLFRLEKAAVCDELIAHFEDGHRAGASYEDLLNDFGDTSVTAKLISRGKKRSRSMFLKIGLRRRFFWAGFDRDLYWHGDLLFPGPAQSVDRLPPGPERRCH